MIAIAYLPWLKMRVLRAKIQPQASELLAA
jgi:hypothetical protein